MKHFRVGAIQVFHSLPHFKEPPTSKLEQYWRKCLQVLYLRASLGSKQSRLRPEEGPGYSIPSSCGLLLQFIFQGETCVTERNQCIHLGYWDGEGRADPQAGRAPAGQPGASSSPPLIITAAGSTCWPVNWEREAKGHGNVLMQIGLHALFYSQGLLT